MKKILATVAVAAALAIATQLPVAVAALQASSRASGF